MDIAEMQEKTTEDNRPHTSGSKMEDETTARKRKQFNDDNVESRKVAATGGQGDADTDTDSDEDEEPMNIRVGIQPYIRTQQALKSEDYLFRRALFESTVDNVINYNLEMFDMDHLRMAKCKRMLELLYEKFEQIPYGAEPTHNLFNEVLRDMYLSS